jgi:hypothetical protein
MGGPPPGILPITEADPSFAPKQEMSVDETVVFSCANTIEGIRNNKEKSTFFVIFYSLKWVFIKAKDSN